MFALFAPLAAVAQKLHMLQVELQLETAEYGDACRERGRVYAGGLLVAGDSSASRAGLRQAGWL